MPKRTGRYKEDDLKEALKKISEGKLSKHAASRLYCIPRSTLQFRAGHKFVKERPGPNTYLTSAEEEEIVSWLSYSYRKVFPKRREDVVNAVKLFLTDSPREHPFGTENTPGYGWYTAF